MHKKDESKLLQNTNIQIDPSGMVLIDDETILDGIQGAMTAHSMPWDKSANGACYNSGC